MKATIVDLRYKMKDILRALDRRERVSILYHGKLKGVIVPADEKSKKKASTHPFFGMTVGETKTVDEAVEEIRGGRYRDI